MKENLEQYIHQLGFNLPAGSTDRLLAFVQLLEKWNKVYNLTAVRDPGQMLTRHIMDSLVVAPFITGQHVLDVGSGAGLPGIPLAIIQPEKEFVLLDSNNKKTRFITQAATELGLDNVEVINQRIESYKPDGLFDVIISRAFSSIVDMVTSVGDKLKTGGEILAMKGAYPVAEMEQIPEPFEVKKVEVLQVPGLDADRHLVIIQEKSD